MRESRSAKLEFNLSSTSELNETTSLSSGVACGLLVEMQGVGPDQIARSY